VTFGEEISMRGISGWLSESLYGITGL